MARLRRALRVIGKHDDCDATHELRKTAFDLGRASLERLLGVDANQLLAARQDAKLVDRGQRRRAHELATHTALLEQPGQQRTAIVGADGSREHGLRAERGEVERNVGRAAGALLGLAVAHDNNRCFGRDPRGVAEPILVEHRITGDEHS